jgi:nucleoside-diphosphate-sugar epimerase
MIIAITGINGYLGTELRNFLKDEFEILGLSSHPKSNEVLFDIYTSAAPKVITADILIHLGWLASDGTETINNLNLESSRKLFENAIKSGVKKTIFISSMSSYKEAKSNYGKTKYKVEQLANQLGVLVVRPGLIISDINPGGTYLQLIKQVKNRLIVPIISGGNQLQYTIDLKQLVSFLKRICLEQSQFHASQNPYLVCNLPPATMKELIISINQGKKPLFLNIPYFIPFLLIRLIEVCGIKIKPSSDSLKGMYYYNTEKIIPFEI